MYLFFLKMIICIFKVVLVTSKRINAFLILSKITYLQPVTLSIYLFCLVLYYK